MSERDREDKTIIITAKADLTIGEGQEPYLIQVSGRETGQMYHLKGRDVKIGRDPGLAVCLDDLHVSRQHAELKWIGKELIIRDLGSTNGVFVNGKKIKEQTLQNGDKILIGTRMYFKFAYQDAIDQNYQQSLFNAANVDALTQVYNKKFFLEHLSKEFSFTRRSRQPLTLLMMDVDFFKKINDTYGHLAGDAVLKQIGQFLKKTLRLENTACRYGGEEFGIILRNTDGEQAWQIAERIRKTVEGEPVEFQGQKIQVTISLGIASFTGDNFATFEDLISQADQNLYAAKQGGRNQTVFQKAA